MKRIIKKIINWLFGGAFKTDSSKITKPKSYSHYRTDCVWDDNEPGLPDKQIFLTLSHSILRLLKDSTSEFKKNKMSLITSPYFDTSAITQMTTDETYNLLVSSEPQIARDIISHSFPKQQDFNRLVKLIDDRNQEEYQTEITKKGNTHFYSYCRGVKCVNDIEQRLQDVSLLENILSPLTSQKDKEQKIEMLNSDVEWGRQLINPADSDFEPVYILYKNLLDLVAYLYKNEIITDEQKKEIYNSFDVSLITDIFDVSKYLDDRITNLGATQNIEKKQTPKNRVSIVPLEKLIVVKTKDVRDDAKSNIAVEYIKKYYIALIANKERTKGVSTGKLFLALRKLGYLSQEDKSIFMRSIKEFGKREINKDFSIGADNGMYRFITDDEKNHRKDIEELKKDLEKCCNEAGNMVESS